MVYPKNLTVQPFVVASTPQSQQTMLMASDRLAKRADELIDRLHAAVPDSDIRGSASVFCQIASWRGELICATTINSTLAEGFSGRQGLSLTLGCALPSSHFLMRTDIAWAVQRLLRERFEDACGIRNLVSQTGQALREIASISGRERVSRLLLAGIEQKLDQLYGIRGPLSAPTLFILGSSRYRIRQETIVQTVSQIDDFWKGQQVHTRTIEGSVSQLPLALSLLAIGLLFSLANSLSAGQYPLASLIALDFAQLLAVLSSTLLSFFEGALARSSRDLHILACALSLALVATLFAAVSLFQLVLRLSGPLVL